MKNIHIIPTDKPSRLYDDGLELYLLIKASNSNNDLISYKNIYITIDEEIKEGDWVITPNPQKPLEKVTKETYLPHYNKKRKIILTTDQDLIADGVQAIDDSFLEWFINNSSCEYVEVNKIYNDYGETDIFDLVCTPHSFKYKITIPKEEVKYSVKKEYVDDQDAYGYDVIVKEKSKQETLEEAAKNYAHKSFIWPLNKQGEKQSIPPGQLVPPGYAKHQKITTKYFINGAKWQQERSYSNEEVLNIILKYELAKRNKGIYWSDREVKEWFEQFKKK